MKQFDVARSEACLAEGSETRQDDSDGEGLLELAGSRDRINTRGGGAAIAVSFSCCEASAVSLHSARPVETLFIVHRHVSGVLVGSRAQSTLARSESHSCVKKVKD